MGSQIVDSMTSRLKGPSPIAGAPLKSAIVTFYQMRLTRYRGYTQIVMRHVHHTSVLIVVALSIALQSCSCNVYPSIHWNILTVSFSDFQGVSMTAAYPLDSDSTYSRFTPWQDDIELAEHLVHEKLEQLNKDLTNQTPDGPIIHNHLNSYFRQYVGYIDSTGDKILFINMLWLDSTIGPSLSEARSRMIRVYDGGSYYWSIRVNLTRRTLFDLSVNGKA